MVKGMSGTVRKVTRAAAQGWSVLMIAYLLVQK